MILPDWMIRDAQITAPFHERTVQNGMSFGVSSAGYDVRVKQETLLRPGDFALLSTVEHFTMPGDVLAIVHDKSTWARRGLALQNTVIEPGWRGFLTLEATNHSPNWIKIEAGDPIAQIVFHQMAAPPEAGYGGKYMDQPDEPVSARVEVA
jgi:dCTP deaminase